jgi:group I intron endonuclease
MPHIYLIRLNGVPKYIGYTSHSLEKRWSQHISAAKTGYSQVLYNAIRKYGENSFSIESIYTHEDTKHLRDVMEPKFIEEYRTHVKYGSGYNLTEGGEGCIGWIPTEETKKRISEATKGKKRSKETCERISKSKKGCQSWMKGKKHTQEARMKMSLSKKRNSDR